MGARFNFNTTEGTCEVSWGEPEYSTRRSMVMPVTIDQLLAWRKGKLIQDAMPQLTPDQREFIMSGILPDEWDAMWRDDE